MKRHLKFVIVFALGFFSSFFIFKAREAQDDRMVSPLNRRNQEVRRTNTQNNSSGIVSRNPRDEDAQRHESSEVDTNEVNANKVSTNATEATEVGYIKASNRYQMIMRKLTERHETPGWLQFGKNFEPSGDMQEFFGFDNDTKEAIMQICNEYRKLLKDWEIEHRTLLKSTGDELVYQIPANPELADKMNKEFIGEMYSMLGSDGVNFLEGSSNQFFDDLRLSRNVKFSILDAADNVWEYRYRVESLDKNGDVKASFGSNDFVKKDGSSVKPPIVPGRYDHFFSIK